MIRVYLSGQHAHRTPLSYPALSPLWAGRILRVHRPEDADLHVYAHILDLQSLSFDAVWDWRRRRKPVVLLSEEPFWDTIWGKDPLSRDRMIETRYGTLPVIQLNHHTSDIFHFDRIPYYLLTNHRFCTLYANRFARNARLSNVEWLASFESREMHLTFMAEHRPEAHHNVRWAAGDITGLCAWRTDLARLAAEQYPTEGPLPSERLGQSWHGGPHAARLQLPNWYLDKMVRLDGRSRILSGIENTHQPAYITEKIFDAFASGAIPLYVASPGHRIHDVGLPPESWLNLHGLSPTEALERIVEHRFDTAVCAAYADAQDRLQTLFGDPSLLVSERERLASAVIRELHTIKETPPV